jgi:hypothetical protein
MKTSTPDPWRIVRWAFAFFTAAVVAWGASLGFGWPPNGAQILVILVALVPSIIYILWVRNRPTILICGAVLLLVTGYTWSAFLSTKSQNLSAIWVLFGLAFTLLFSITGATVDLYLRKRASLVQMPAGGSEEGRQAR